MTIPREEIERQADEAATTLDDRWNKAVNKNDRRHYRSGVRDGYRFALAACEERERQAKVEAKIEAHDDMQVALFKHRGGPSCSFETEWLADRVEKLQKELARLKASLA